MEHLLPKGMGFVLNLSLWPCSSKYKSAFETLPVGGNTSVFAHAKKDYLILHVSQQVNQTAKALPGQQVAALSLFI